MGLRDIKVQTQGSHTLDFVLLYRHAHVHACIDIKAQKG